MSARWTVCYQPDYPEDGIGAPVVVVSHHRYLLVARIAAAWARITRPAGMAWVEAFGGRQ